MSDATKETGADAPPQLSVSRSPLRYLYIAAGLMFVGLGALGVLLPGLPTTPFMILAAWMFSRSSARFHAWLWNHRVFGPYIRQWSRHRVIPTHAKVISVSFMVVGLGIVVYRDLPLFVTGVVALACAWGAVFVLRCPSAAPQRFEG
jgi:hypothetical protein